ncbi:hypothetical protein MXF48_25050, partial [Escherichia coli]|nr:hypothetical protein [Escherichia coli]
FRKVFILTLLLNITYDTIIKLIPQPIRIYHNVALYAPLKRAQRVSGAKTAKRDVFPGANRKNASGTFSARCMTMHETEWRSVWARLMPIRRIFGRFQP